MKYLNGSELAGFIKERQSRQARQLLAKDIRPKLAIVICDDNPASLKYISLKQKYGADLGVEVQVIKTSQSEAKLKIKELNDDKTVHGIIVQLPLPDRDKTEEIVNSILPSKDVDSLSADSKFDPATPMAINWLLSGYNIDLRGKQIVIVGRGKLVGAPLYEMWKKSNINSQVVDEFTKDKESIIKEADIIVTAVGKPGIITSDLVKNGAVVVDAGVASEKGTLKGDVADEVYEREDITITPKIGGVGPLTVCALFDNLIRASQKYE